jgi:hypothetical protein
MAVKTVEKMGSLLKAMKSANSHEATEGIQR